MEFNKKTTESCAREDAEHQKTQASSKAPHHTSGSVFFWRLANKKENKKYSDFWEKHKGDTDER
jgi:hypothetical protein